MERFAGRGYDKGVMVKCLSLIALLCLQPAFYCVGAGTVSTCDARGNCCCSDTCDCEVGVPTQAPQDWPAPPARTAGVLELNLHLPSVPCAAFFKPETGSFPVTPTTGHVLCVCSSPRALLCVWLT